MNREMLKTAVLLVLLAGIIVRILPAENLPEEPKLKSRTHGFVMVAPGDPFQGDANVVHNWTDPKPQHNFVRRHAKWFAILGGIGVGAVIGLKTRHTFCHYNYDGHPYYGTTCPSPDARGAR